MPFLLQLRHPFGLSRGTTTTIPVFFTRNPLGGWGEGSPVRYRGEDAAVAQDLAAHLAAGVDADNLFDREGHHARARGAAPAQRCARAAFDIALHDAIARRLDIPLWKLLGFRSPDGVVSSFTIALDTDDVMLRKVDEAASFPILKIKLGRDAASDIRTMQAIRAAAPSKTLRVDANAGWSLDTARECIRVLADLGVEFVEQPLAIGNLAELRVLQRESPLPIIADEDALDLPALPALAGAVDGINIKLMKCGGIWEACQMIAFARAQGWRVMLGCMIESSLAIGAAAHLAGAVDACDLDAEHLVSNNPCGPRIVDDHGVIHIPPGPGIGAAPHSPLEA